MCFRMDLPEKPIPLWSLPERYTPLQKSRGSPQVDAAVFTIRFSSVSSCLPLSLDSKLFLF